MDELNDGQLRAVNEAIASNYDAVVYDPAANPLLDVPKIFGLAALYGEVNQPADVLDLGCGTGVQLVQTAGQTGGRIVGTDLSAEAVRLAQERLRPFGDRATILRQDFLELTAAELGQFDYILNIGVIFITPPEVQRKILALVGECLRPGGVAVLSYYAGSVPTIRANLHRTLRASTEGMERIEAVQTARRHLGELGASLANAAGGDLLRAAIADTERHGDVIFYHEVLNNAFEAVQTSQVARQLADRGVSFCDYLPSSGTNPASTSPQRALAADVLDFNRGQYRYAVFAKAGQSRAANVASPQIIWESGLDRANRGDLTGEQLFTQRGGEAQATIRQPASMAMLDCLAEAPLGWADLVSRTTLALERAGIGFSGTEQQNMEADLHLLRFHGLVAPLFASQLS